MDLTILIPSIPERLDTLKSLINKLEKQIVEAQAQDVVEIISLIDNKKISIGAKRERLKNMAEGRYFAFVDDDDDVSSDYIGELAAACQSMNTDVITFDTWANIEGKEGLISVSHHNKENEQFKPGEMTLRKPSHVNAWLTEKFQKFEFSDKMYGEDFDFCEQCYPLISTEYIIPKILHFYTYDKEITRAF